MGDRLDSQHARSEIIDAPAQRDKTLGQIASNHKFGGWTVSCRHLRWSNHGEKINIGRVLFNRESAEGACEWRTWLVKPKRLPDPPTGFHEDEGLEAIVSEDEDRASSPFSYDILTYPVDFTLEVLVGKLLKDQPDIRIPEFQREFAWSQAQASKLIESFLLGLPVPPIFLYTDPGNVRMVVDGQQRLRSIAYYFEGYFGPESNGRRPVFRLSGLNKQSPYNEMTYRDLESKDSMTFRKLNDSALRAFVIKQLNPRDHTSVFHIFERLNTGGTFLTGQEIRNCVYEGKFNDLLRELNLLAEWRDLFGRGTKDKRMRDVELILRFFALAHASESYKKSMKDFLSAFMSKHQNPTQAELTRLSHQFSETARALRQKLGPKPFHVPRISIWSCSRPLAREANRSPVGLRCLTPSPAGSRGGARSWRRGPIRWRSQARCPCRQAGSPPISPCRLTWSKATRRPVAFYGSRRGIVRPPGGRKKVVATSEKWLNMLSTR